MKTFLCFLLFVCSIPAFSATTVLNCRVTKIYNDNIFEESLSTDEYPEVYLDQEGRDFELMLGSTGTYRSVDGDKISVSRIGAKLFVTAQYKDSPSRVFLEVNAVAGNSGKRWGVLNYKKDGRYNPQAVALFICNK